VDPDERGEDHRDDDALRGGGSRALLRKMERAPAPLAKDEDGDPEEEAEREENVRRRGTDAPAEEREVLPHGRETARIGGGERQTAIGEEAAEGGDERRDLELRDEEAVPRADHERDGDRREDRDDRRLVMIDLERGGDDAEEGHARADGEIDPAGED